jgi:hypothetical protein
VPSPFRILRDGRDEDDVVGVVGEDALEVVGVPGVDPVVGEAAGVEHGE